MAQTDPHANQPVMHTGAPLESAKAVMIMIHGRGAAPRDILPLGANIDRPGMAYVAPAAAGGAWYPLPFIAPREQNEPWLGSALGVIESLVLDLIKQGFPSHKMLLLGFSQGACLASEFSIRHPRRYGGVLALSGGLIGAPGTKWDDVTTTALKGTPVFLGCSDIDSHIPKERVIESDAVFTRLGARVTRKLYPGMGHAVNDDEIQNVQAVVDDALSG
jgi:phospholipase/carboxylesterase